MISALHVCDRVAGCIGDLTEILRSETSINGEDGSRIAIVIKKLESLKSTVEAGLAAPSYLSGISEPRPQRPVDFSPVVRELRSIIIDLVKVVQNERKAE